MSNKPVRAQSAVLVFIESLAAVAKSEDRSQACDVGAIGALVALLVGTKGEVPARCSFVLRDLAQDPANRAAIEKAGGVERLVRLLGVNDEAAAEAADALRALCSGNLSACVEVGRHEGVRALVELIKSGHAAVPAAAGALANMANAEPSGRARMGEAGAIGILVQVIGSGLRVGSRQAASWPRSPACEESVRALSELSAERSCLALLCGDGREAGVIASLTEVMLQRRPSLLTSSINSSITRGLARLLTVL